MPQGSNVEAFPGSSERLEQMLEEEYLRGWRERGESERQHREDGSRLVHRSRIRYHAWWLPPLALIGLALTAEMVFSWFPELRGYDFPCFEAVAIGFAYHLFKVNWHYGKLGRLNRKLR